MTEDVREAEEQETEPGTQPEKEEVKGFSQSEVNALLAKERRAHTMKLNALQEQFDQFRQQTLDAETALENKAKEQVTALRQDLPDSITKLLDKLTYQEQLDWLSDPANKIEKKTIPQLPQPGGGKPQPEKRHRVVI